MNELQLQLRSGLTLYLQARTPAGQCWNGTAYEAENDSNWPQYAISLIEPVPNSGVYFASMPAGLTAGLTLMPVFIQDGTTPASTDDQYQSLHGTSTLTLCVDWSGSVVNSIAPLGRWNGPSILSLPQSQTALSINRAAAILDSLYTARAALAAGGNVINTVVDGETVTFTTPEQIDKTILFWERKVAILTGKRRRVMQTKF